MREPYPGYYKEERRYYLRVGILMVCAFGLMMFLASTAMAATLDPLLDYRYGGPPKRDAYGQIVRRADVQRAFQKIHPCPSTGLKAGACPGWQKDHIWPLASCGADAVSNLQWLPIEIKTCAGTTCKDRFERQVYTCNQGGYQ